MRMYIHHMEGEGMAGDAGKDWERDMGSVVRLQNRIQPYVTYQLAYLRVCNRLLVVSDSYQVHRGEKDTVIQLREERKVNDYPRQEL